MLLKIEIPIIASITENPIKIKNAIYILKKRIFELKTTTDRAKTNSIRINIFKKWFNLV